MAVQIQLRNDTSSNWESVDPVLAQGEVGIATDLNLMKVGDGTSTWTELDYIQVDTTQVSYTHTQGVASDTWVIAHNLGYNPNIQIFDSGENLVEGSVTHTDANNITVTFSIAISGVAYLS